MLCLKCRLEIENTEISHYGLHLNCFKEWFSTSHATEFISLKKRSSATSEAETRNGPQDTSFFHGKFKKYSADLDGNSYILKMKQEEVEELPEVEYLCNQIGKQLGIPVAEFYFINFHDENTFVTKNFIAPSGAPTDLQHIYHFRPDDQHSCEGIINAIIKQTEKPYDVKIIIKTILFDALIGNHDRHGRNLAFIAKAKDFALSPIYDNVSYLALEKDEMLKADHNPTGRICTSDTFEPSMKDYVKEFKKLGYQDVLKEFYQSIKIELLIQLITESYCSDQMKEAIKKLVKKRFTELENEYLN